MNGLTIQNVGKISTDTFNTRNLSSVNLDTDFINGTKARFTTLEYATLTQVVTAANFQDTITVLEVNDYVPNASDVLKGNQPVTGHAYFNVNARFNRKISVFAPCVMDIGYFGAGNYSESIKCESNTYGINIFNGTMLIGNKNPNASTSYFDLNASTDPISNGFNKGINYDGPVNLLGNYGLSVQGAVTLKNDLNVTGNVISSSDKKLKNNITKLEACLEKIQNVNGYRYNRIDLEGQAQLGLIAQEVEINFPELVFEKNNFKSINYSSFIAVLLQCIKELKNKIEILENKILI